nr:transposase [Tenacibaculum maritimum]
MFGKIYGDKGYLGKDLFDKLFVDGIHLITKLRKNMKKKALDFMDKVYLRKRAIIESVNDVLKNTCQIEHSRHRSFDNFLGNLIAGLIAYSFLESKPSIKTQRFLPNHGIS